MKVSVLLLVSLALTRSESNTCPHPEDIRPCTCRISPDKSPDIVCENLKSADELIRIVKNMGSISVNTFELHKSNIGVLPAEAFKGIQIKSLYIMNSNLTKLSEDRNRPPFSGLENSLDYLEIKASFVNNSPLTLLSVGHLKKISTIQLEGNLIPSIGNNWFESGPYELKDLYFYNSSLSSLGSHAFEALEHLQFFALTSSPLSEIKRSMFSNPASSLQSIDLSGNKLQSLPEDIFTKMPSLTEVFLENNAFSSISEVAFAPIWSNLEYVFFHGNPIKCDKDLQWIYKYRLPGHLDGFCHSPDQLRGRNLRNLTISDLQ